MLIVDAHQDLAYNMLAFGRDYTLSAAEIRQREDGTKIPLRNGDTLLGWPDYQRGQVAVIFATLFVSPIRRQQSAEWDLLCYKTIEQAHILYNQQVDVYYRLVETYPDKFKLILGLNDLNAVVDHWRWEKQSEHPVGLVILMEGAEGVREPAELEEWWERGVRIIGPAWAGTRFCGGTREPGPLTGEGFALLERMAEFGFALDLSHMDEKAVLQALDIYPGAIIASHSNATALLKGYENNRLLSDRVIRGLLERDGVVGVVPANGFLDAGWQDNGDRQSVTLQHVVAQIDHICQLAGNAYHVGLGSDFDGGFGLQSVPVEIDTLADLQKLAPLLTEMGYSETDIAAIFGANWLNFLHRILPEAS